FGIRTCVASLGTAFTEQQAKLISRVARKVVLNYDGDKAGVKAARRAIETLLTQDVELEVLILPDGQDPDDFIRANGFEAYKNQYKKNVLSFLQFVMEDAERTHKLSSPKEKAEAIADLLPVLSAIKNPIQKRDAFDQTMNFLRVEDAILKRDLWKTVKLGTRFETQTVRQQVARATQARMTEAEHLLLELLIYDKELREIILPQLEETDYESLATAEIFRALLALKEIGSEVTSENLLEIVSDDAAASDFVPVLLMSEPARQPDDAIDDVLQKAEKNVIALRKMAINEKILEISQKLYFAEQNGDSVLLNQLVVQQIELEKIKRSLSEKVIGN
ncbi:MAG: toprim domain-containing protein, partial [Acidobacteriota bacterium]|nr:toprim domain-containing protein [Acidobacteriota bacterium]